MKVIESSYFKYALACIFGLIGIGYAVCNLDGIGWMVAMWGWWLAADVQWNQEEDARQLMRQNKVAEE